MKEKQSSKSKRHCSNCGKDEDEFPMVFRNGPWCSDDCRKVLQGEVTVERALVNAPEALTRINRGTVIR